MKTTSRELSTQLKKAGAKQESAIRWCKSWNASEGEYEWILTEPLPPGVEESVDEAASFDCDELLEGLSPNDNQEADLATNDMGYTASVRQLPSNDKICERYADTPSEALGKLKLWCLENGHCEREKV